MGAALVRVPLEASQAVMGTFMLEQASREVQQAETEAAHFASNYEDANTQ
jgi:hypothetical protein